MLAIFINDHICPKWCYTVQNKGKVTVYYIWTKEHVKTHCSLWLTLPDKIARSTYGEAVHKYRFFFYSYFQLNNKLLNNLSPREYNLYCYSSPFIFFFYFLDGFVHSLHYIHVASDTILCPHQTIDSLFYRWKTKCSAVMMCTKFKISNYYLMIHDYLS